MTVEDAIKYLKQLYPNGGHCWLDEQRIEAIGMAVKALQEEPVSDIEAYQNRWGKSNGYKEPVSEDLEAEIKKAFLNNECSVTDAVSLSAFTRIARHFVNWQKEQMMKDVMPCVLEWYDGFVLNFTEEQLNDVVTKNNINIGDKVKVIVIKED